MCHPVKIVTEMMQNSQKGTEKLAASWPVSG